MGRFALAHPGFYLLKMIQSAVAMGARTLRISTTQRGLGLWFDSEADFDFADFPEAVSNPAHPVPEALRLLADGFNASLWGGVSNACVIAWTREGGQGLFLGEEGLVIGGAPPRPSDLPGRGNVWMFSLSKSSSRWRQREVEQEMAAVRERCLYLPLEFSLDDEPVRRRPAHSSWLVERLDLAPDGGLRLSQPVQGGRRLGEAGWLRTEAGETFCLQPPIYFRSPVVQCQAAYFLSLDLTGEDRVAFVRHGVVIATHPLDSLGAGALAIVDAADLNVDISGFGLVRDDRLKLKVESVRSVWREMAYSLNGPELELLPADSTLSGLVPPALTAGLSALLLPAASTPLGLLAAIGALGLAYKGARHYQGSEFSAARRRSDTRRRLVTLLDRQWPWSGGKGGG